MSPRTTHLDRYPTARTVEVDHEWLRVDLRDGRQISVPIAWFDWLKDASNSDLADFEIIEGGQGIWWNAIDEGLSVPWLFGLPHH